MELCHIVITDTGVQTVRGGDPTEAAHGKLMAHGHGSDTVAKFALFLETHASQYVSLSVCLSVCMSVCLSVCMYVTAL